MKFTEINMKMRYVECAGEKFINLLELDSFLKKYKRIEMEECLITPFYIQDNKRMELYQYEFCCTNELNFENYLLRKTGKEKIEDVPKEVFILRSNCFSSSYEPNRLAEYIKFLFENKLLKEEIMQVFGEYDVKNLFVVIY